jgi:hypothetical protein
MRTVLFVVCIALAHVAHAQPASAPSAGERAAAKKAPADKAAADKAAAEKAAAEKAAADKAATEKAAVEKLIASVPPKAPDSGASAFVTMPLSQFVALTRKAENPAFQYVQSFFELLSSLAWPVLAGFVAWIVLKRPEVAAFLARSSSRVTKVSVAGLEITLSEGAKATIEDLNKLLLQVPESHREWASILTSSRNSRTSSRTSRNTSRRHVIAATG